MMMPALRRNSLLPNEKRIGRGVRGFWNSEASDVDAIGIEAVPPLGRFGTGGGLSRLAPISGRRSGDHDIHRGRERARLQAVGRLQAHVDPFAPARIAHRVAVDEVALVERIAGEMELRREPPAVGGRDLEMDVRRATRIGDGLQRAKAVQALAVRHDLAVALERRIAALASRLPRMIVKALRIALPDLDIAPATGLPAASSTRPCRCRTV